MASGKKSTREVDAGIVSDCRQGPGLSSLMVGTAPFPWMWQDYHWHSTKPSTVRSAPTFSFLISVCRKVGPSPRPVECPPQVRSDWNSTEWRNPV